MFAPYKVATFDTIGDDFKDADGTWVNDYGGYMSIGYDSSKVPDVTKVSDLLGPAFKGKVALNGNPTEAGAAASGVMMASLANGGSADDISPGVDFFSKLKKAGNFLPVDPTPATIESKQTPVVIDWDYLNAAETAKLKTWKVVVPTDADPIAGYYNQAINKDGPHPAVRAVVGGVPVQRRGSEPLARRWRPPDPGRRHGQGRDDRQGRSTTRCRRSRAPPWS